ncbi:MAG: HNH endonuclease [Polyangiaceae bacterium]|nr:HNH endonuclease [Polyangiaceae bacterium]
MRTVLSTDLRARIDAADRRVCCYCRIAEANSGVPLSYDHIEPRARGGITSFENICLCCRPCNEFKCGITDAVDPLTHERVPLFHPRRQIWQDHFAWSPDTTMLEGRTPIGRATIAALRMNRPMLVAARRRWYMAGWHPPDHDI